LVQWVLGSFPEPKGSGREINQTPLSSAENKIGWSYTSTHAIRLHGVVRDNFTFPSLHESQYFLANLYIPVPVHIRTGMCWYRYIRLPVSTGNRYVPVPVSTGNGMYRYQYVQAPVCTSTGMYWCLYVQAPVCNDTGMYRYRYVLIPVCTGTGMYCYRYVQVPVCTVTGMYRYRYVLLPVCTGTCMYMYRYVLLPVCTCTGTYRYAPVPSLHLLLLCSPSLNETSFIFFYSFIYYCFPCVLFDENQVG